MILNRAGRDLIVDLSKDICMLIKSISGVELGGGVSAKLLMNSLAYVEAGSNYRVEFLFRCVLNEGVYFLNAGVVGDVCGSETYLSRLIDVAMFRVRPATENFSMGIVDFDCNPKIELLELQQAQD